MGDRFDREYWDRHWADRHAADRHGDDRGEAPGSMAASPPHPYLAQELSRLSPGTALDAGCGAGAEAVWLARRGWTVTAADISAEAVRLAAARVAEAGLEGAVRLELVDLSQWEPGSTFDLVTTHYAHPAMPQLELYARIARWVSPGGTLLVVAHRSGPEGPGAGHGHGEHGHGRGDSQEDGASHAAAATTAAAITGILDTGEWVVETADEPDRPLPGAAAGAGAAAVLRDVVVRATRRG